MEGKQINHAPLVLIDKLRPIQGPRVNNISLQLKRVDQTRVDTIYMNMQLTMTHSVLASILATTLGLWIDSGYNPGSLDRFWLQPWVSG